MNGNAISTFSTKIRVVLNDALSFMMQSLIFIISAILVQSVSCQNPTLGLNGGLITFDTSSFKVQLVEESQTLYALNTSGHSNVSGFNFIPTDMMSQRQYDGNYHLGDITFRVRPLGSSNWTSGDSSVARQPVNALPVQGNTFAAADLTPTLPVDSLLKITRRWVTDNEELEVLFDVENHNAFEVEIGALGMPLEFNNVRV